MSSSCFVLCVVGNGAQSTGMHDWNSHAWVNHSSDTLSELWYLFRNIATLFSEFFLQLIVPGHGNLTWRTLAVTYR